MFHRWASAKYLLGTPPRCHQLNMLPRLKRGFVCLCNIGDIAKRKQSSNHTTPSLIWEPHLPLWQLLDRSRCCRDNILPMSDRITAARTRGTQKANEMRDQVLCVDIIRQENPHRLRLQTRAAQTPSQRCFTVDITSKPEP